MPKTARQYQSGDIRRKNRGKKRALFSVTGALLAACLSAPGNAQSSYGCEDLDRSAVPAIEGNAGTFFRIDPDLLMDTRLPAPMIESVAAISRNLASHGTRLIYVPVPTKALVQAEDLGSEAVRLGYDVRLARALYADSIVHLRSEGITTVDAVQALASAPSNQPAFFRTDPRMTNEGLRNLAHAIADEAGEGLVGDVAYTTTIGEVIDLVSPDRFRLQLSCQAELPGVSMRSFTTTTQATTREHTPVALVGSTISGGDERDLPGFLAAALRRPVTHVTFAESAHAAMLGYLTSEEFGQQRPEVIVWLVPIWQNPALYGDQPFREIAAAAADRCTDPRRVPKSDSGQYKIDLDRHSASDNLRLEIGGVPIANATFRFISPTGQTRTRRVVRQDPGAMASAIFMPLSGLWPEGAASVTVEVDAAPANAPTISVCRG